MIPTEPILYTKKALIISIPTNDAGQLHHDLLKAFSAIFKQQLIHPLENPADADAVASLADLHQALLPTASQLEKILDPA